MTIRIRWRIAATALLCVAIVALYAINAVSANDEPLITITDRGFEPAEISVSPGTLVTFVNKSSHASWPASNPHPTHTENPFFDTQKPLYPDASWSVMFQHAGDYRFHDHLREAHHGIIHVRTPLTESATALVTAIIPRDCGTVRESEKTACMESRLRATLEDDGLPAAFELFLHYYRTEPVFVTTSCHWHAHLLGEEAYRLYAAGEHFSLIPEVSYCGYGFFHGFMTRLMSDNPDYMIAKRFCEEATLDIIDQAPLARVNCFHGIGHGFIEEPVSDEYWGKPQELWRRAFPICDRISDLAYEREECIEGAYNGVVLFMESNQYGFTLDTKDLFKWCREEQPQYQEGCYFEFGQKIGYSIDDDLTKLPPLLSQVPVAYQERVAWVAAAGQMQAQIAEPSHLPLYGKCQHLANDAVRSACLHGIVGGYRAHGEPGKSHERALAFCGDPGLKAVDVRRCYAYLVRTFNTVYNNEKMRSVCESVPSTYRPEQCAEIQKSNT